ncbi:hypothetical protein BDP27DRAFT_1218384 [Rhodocollybia butyracea]|uniref:Uncharacterized protein n=1 Tax=Rhodocollybia butyracea TaxID=206335 RepID=A0A9P5PZ30_9AGAR|nr:hypothetical protein BDP27DRAFT_1218384 [Rhodocollybia butyracea]
MSFADEPFCIGSLYLAGFAQAVAPHVGLIIPTSVDKGVLVHIRIDRNISPNWARQARTQNLSGDMFLTSLLKIGDCVPVDALRNEAEQTTVPDNGEFGECSVWVMKLVDRLNDKGLIHVANLDALKQEFDVFVSGNRRYARRDLFPNIAVSSFCGGQKE